MSRVGAYEEVPFIKEVTARLVTLKRVRIMYLAYNKYISVRAIFEFSILMLRTMWQKKPCL